MAENRPAGIFTRGVTSGSVGDLKPYPVRSRKRDLARRKRRVTDFGPDRPLPRLQPFTLHVTRPLSSISWLPPASVTICPL
jgi:hypothetical protein